MKIKVEGERAVALCRISPVVLSILPMLEGPRSWLKSGGLSFAATGHNLSIWRGIGAEIELPDSHAEEFDFPAPLTNYSSRTEAYDHQKAAASKMGSKNNFALFMEQGTGKTKVAIDRAGALFAQGKITGMLIVSKKGVHRQWLESEFLHHYGAQFYGYAWPFKEFPAALAATGAILKVLAINYDALRTPNGMDAAWKFCSAHKNHLMIVADESQEIRNAKSGRSKSMAKLGVLASHRLLLTGTPIAKDLTDEWAQLRWLDDRILGIKYITTFRSEYCLMGGFQLREVVGAKNMERFRSKVDPWTFRVTKEEIGILPKQYNEWVFDMTARQRDMIKEVQADFRIRLDSGDITVSEAISVASKIQQISNGFVIDNDGKAIEVLPWSKNPRIIALMEWLEAQDDRVIIWFRFRKDAELISSALSHSGVDFVSYYGGTPDKDRQAAVDSFKRAGGARVFLGNPQSAGTGLNLQGTSNRVLYYSNSFNSIDRWQSEDRNHRIGTVGAVTYTDLIAKGSRDRKITANLRKKKGVSEMAIGDIINLVLGDE